MNILEIAKKAAQIAADKKAKRITLIDLQGQSDLCDYQLVCSGMSDVQTKAICDAIQLDFKKSLSLMPSTIEGKTGGYWILMDYGSLNIHIFFEQVRDYYALESLWPKAKFLELSLS